MCNSLPMDETFPSFSLSCLDCSSNSESVQRYVHPQDAYACCLTNDYFHERCSYKLPLEECKNLCDLDPQCKGYVQWVAGRCNIATTSPCPNGSKKYDIGRTGNLGGKCGRNYNGCYVKECNTTKCFNGRCSTIRRGKIM